MADDVAPAIPARMLPAINEHNRAFWTGGADGQLLIARCAGVSCGCSHRPRTAPTAGVRWCPVRCRVGGPFSPTRSTTNRSCPPVPVPYVIAIVELDEQADLRIATNIVDCEPDSVHIGLPVEVRFERHDVDDDSVFFPVFAPRTA